MTYVRQLSALENSFLAFDSDDYSSMCNQFVIEGLGGLSALALKSAIETATESNPGIALRLKGNWFFKHWDSEGKAPELHFQKNAWSGLNSEGAFFDGEKLDCRKGVCAQVHVIEGDFPKIIFRTHHALMDGNATLFWIQEVFRALRSEQLQGSRCDGSEAEFLKKFKTGEFEKDDFSLSWSSLFEANFHERQQSNVSENCLWLNVIYRRVPERALAKLIAFLYQNQCHKNGNVSVRIPSDLRRLQSEESAYLLGNCVAALDFSFSSDIDEQKLHRELMKRLFRKRDLSVFPELYALGRFLPSAFFRLSENRIRKLCAQGSCDLTAIVTHLGKVSLKDFSYEEFSAKNIYAIPAPLEGVSFSCVMIEHEGGLSTCMSSPKHYADMEKLNAFSKSLAHYFDEHHE